MIYNAGYFTFGGVDSREYNVHISGGGTFDAPERDVEFVSIDGRNGDIVQDNGRFQNVQITYPAFISRTFLENFDNFRAAMYLQTGYQRLYDSYHPLEYREAVLAMAIQPDTGAWNRSGKFDITFNCKPQRFLLSGAEAVEYSLVSSGGIDADDGTEYENEFYYRTDYMSVEPGTLFEADVTYKSSVAAALMVAWYDENKTFISSESASANNHSESVNTWYQGNISATTGRDSTSATRCRTAPAGFAFDDAIGDVTVTIASGFKLVDREYSGTPGTANNYLGTFWSGWTEGETTFTPTEGHYYRFAIAKPDDSTITPDAIPSDAVVISYRTTDDIEMSLSLVVPSNAAYARVMYGFGTGTYIGSTGLTISNNGVETTYGDGGILLINPTGYEAQPIIYLTMSGAATVVVEHLSPKNEITTTTVAITDFSSTGRTDIVIDSVAGDSYSLYLDMAQVPLSLNSYVTITEDGEYADFPTLQAGRTIISTPSNVTGIKVKAGWWTV